MRYFFYGTLMDADILSAVIGRAVAAATLIPAELRGFRRVGVEGAAYPILVPQVNGRVDGVVFDGLSPAEIGRLDRYEGPNYRTGEQPVRLGDGRRVTARVYLPTDRIRPSLVDWSLADWRVNHKAAYLGRIGAMFASGAGR